MKTQKSKGNNRTPLVKGVVTSVRDGTSRLKATADEVARISAEVSSGVDEQTRSIALAISETNEASASDRETAERIESLLTPTEQLASSANEMA
ncbi:MAG: hypothetical protein ACP5MD_03665, partial [Verrucomicrobiia bacterium]